MNVSTSPTPLTLSRVLLAVTGHARHVCFHLIDPDIDTMTEMQHHKSLICPSLGGVTRVYTPSIVRSSP